MSSSTEPVTAPVISTLIIDDEAAARNRLRTLLFDMPGLKLVGEAENGVQALELIERLEPQLLLLDIQMPAMDGFDVLRQLPAQTMPAVIFVTAYDQYALQAFDVSAVDYLLKPYSEERLQQALDKVVKKIAVSQPSKIPENMARLLENLPVAEFVRQLPVRVNKRVKLINVEDISRIVSEHRMINVYDRQSNRYWTNETLEQLQKRLDPERFFRVHRSGMINLMADFEIEPWDDGRLKIHFSDGEVITVAREPAKALKSILGM